MNMNYLSSFAGKCDNFFFFLLNQCSCNEYNTPAIRMFSLLKFNTTPIIIYAKSHQNIEYIIVSHPRYHRLYISISTVATAPIRCFTSSHTTSRATIPPFPELYIVPTHKQHT